MALVGQCGEPLPHTTLQVLWLSVGGCHQGPEELAQVVIGWDLWPEFCLQATSQELAMHWGLSCVKTEQSGNSPCGPKVAGRG